MKMNRMSSLLSAGAAMGVLLGVGFAMPASGQSPAAKSYYVDGAARNAADSNPGTQAAPWRTLHRASTAKELQPRNTVYIKSIFRELVAIKCSGKAGKPLSYEWIPAHAYRLARPSTWRR